MTGEDFREGITAVISLKVPEPQFEGQTKTKLGNNEVEGIITSAFGEFFKVYLEENPKEGKIIVKKGVQAAEAREAAKAARDKVRRKSVLGGTSLPGKLRDCLSKDVEKCEIYLVEGDSAGGSAEGGRLKEFQRFCRCGVKSSMLTRLARTKYWPTKKSSQSSVRCESVSATIRICRNDATIRSSS